MCYRLVTGKIRHLLRVQFYLPTTLAKTPCILDDSLSQPLELYWITEHLENLTWCKGNHYAGTGIGLLNLLFSAYRRQPLHLYPAVYISRTFPQKYYLYNITTARCCGDNLGIFLSGHVRMQLKECITLT